MTAGYDVHIVHNESGVTRTYRHEYEWEPNHGFLWGEGNYSCDCNRRLFFKWASGEDANSEDNVPCSDDIYSVRITADDGKELYCDDHD